MVSAAKPWPCVSPAAAVAAGLSSVWSLIRLLTMRGSLSTTYPEFWVYEVGLPTVSGPGPSGSKNRPSAAIHFGAEYADAIDISPAAETMTNENAARNGVADHVVASTALLQEMVGPYDVVVANILAPTLIELSIELLRVLGPDGSLIISGILADRHAHVLEALQPLRVVQVDELDGWAAVTLQR